MLERSFVIYHAFGGAKTDHSGLERWLIENTKLLANEIGFYIVRSVHSADGLRDALLPFIERMEFLIVVEAASSLAVATWGSDSLGRLAEYFQFDAEY